MFSFKQFDVRQEQCAMKVCTDACIFGAYVPCEESLNILDIGTGTGLLSLMMAQRSPAKSNITAVEIVEGAFLQAKENIENSPFKERIKVLHMDINDFSPSDGNKFDLIVSNPPFYSNNLKSPVEEKNEAKHHALLSFEQLSNIALRLLAPQGKFYVLLPPYESLLFAETMLQKGLPVQSTVTIKNYPDKPIFRVISCFCFYPSDSSRSELIIKEEMVYTPAFTSLLSPYYLYL